MVSLGTVIGLSAVGLLVFFREDISVALGNLKGFGAEFGRDFGKVPDITINIPDFGIPDAFAETGKIAGEAGAGIAGAVGDVSDQINQAGMDARDVIFQAGVQAQLDLAKSLEDLQADFDQFGKDVETNVGIIGTGITDIGTGITTFIGGLFPTKETTVSEDKPQITSRRDPTQTKFGGQTAPKEILTKETATTPELIISKQPDLSLVSPFLKTTQTVEEKPTLTITSRRTGTTGGR